MGTSGVMPIISFQVLFQTITQQILMKFAVQFCISFSMVLALGCNTICTVSTSLQQVQHLLALLHGSENVWKSVCISMIRRYNLIVT